MTIAVMMMKNAIAFVVMNNHSIYGVVKSHFEGTAVLMPLR
ncbi:hypothetical protein [Tolypothrix sp. FACHB-123]|nr:hypothetical protein [Tolypothrix sp. FACHB-123]